MAEENLTPVDTPGARRRTGLGCLIVIILLLGLAYVVGSNLRKSDHGVGPDPEVGRPGSTMGERPPAPPGALAMAASRHSPTRT